VSSELDARYVAPFYLPMMFDNAAGDGWPVEDVLAAARGVQPGEVLALLQGDNWRPQVMGAWFSVRFAEPAVTAVLLQTLRKSFGVLNALPLATAAVAVAGAGATGALREYLRLDLSRRQGAAGFIGATLEHLGAGVEAEVRPGPEITAWDRHAFRRLLDVARQIQSA
jgi:hypothetical protein